MRKLGHVLSCITGMALFFLVCSHGYALSPPTHGSLNKDVANNTIMGFSLNLYLRERLNWNLGTGTDLRGKTVEGWLQYGGEAEDSPLSRSYHHFHNPLRNWDTAGLKGGLLGRSSIVWSQSPDQSWGRYSWQDVRDYYYSALTSIDRSMSDRYYAQMFRGLGQLMHLVHDSSVPYHTRDDVHIKLGHYEYWLEDFRNKDRIEFNKWLSTTSKYGYDPSQLGIAPNPLAPVPIARMIDSDRYGGGNPEVTTTEPVGISEYSNANFLSEDTIFKGFSYPSRSSVEIKEYEIPDPRSLDRMIPRRYYKKTRDGDTDYRLATVTALVALYQDNAAEPLLLEVERPELDSEVYRDYAERLIPRAVGYSSGLLKYFFRGTLEISAPDGFLYSIIDGSFLPQKFTYIKAKVKNTTPKEKNEQGEPISYEGMGPGTLVAVAKFKKRTNYQPDLSADPPTAASREPHFSYSVSAPINIATLSSQTPAEFAFDFSRSPIPAGITDLYLQVVFKGTLGNESDVAIAVGMKDLNEPMHVVSWNSTDRFYLYGQLYTPQQIRSNQELLDLVPPGFNIDPYNALETGVAFYLDDFPENYNAYTGSLPSARFSRIIILTDMPSFNIFVGYYSASPPKDSYFEETVAGVINQEDETGNFLPAPVLAFRGKKAHLWYTLWNFYPVNVGIQWAPWPGPISQDPVPTVIYFP